MVIMNEEFCLIKSKTTFAVVQCNLSYQKCCKNGCCSLEEEEPFNLGLFVILFLLVMLSLSMFIRYCLKNCPKTRTIPRNDSSHQHEVSLMLSFNNIDSSRGFHSQLSSNSPITPPPAYVTPTPPPTYNVALSFPPIATKWIIQPTDLGIQIRKNDEEFNMPIEATPRRI